jgi:hypothetical protein
MASQEKEIKIDEELETLHPRFADTIIQLRDLANKLASGEYKEIASIQERQTKGRKHIKFSGIVDLKVRYYVPNLEGVKPTEEP